MLIGASFVGNAEEANVNLAPCTDYWSFADGYEHGGRDWQVGYDYCNENMNACAAALEGFTIEA